MSRLALWLLPVLAGCQATSDPTGIRYDRDLYGRVYPEKCQRDLTPLRCFMEGRGQLSVRYVPRSEMRTLPNGEKEGASVTLAKDVYGKDDNIIYVANDLLEPHLSDALQHEMVHIHCDTWVHD